MKIFPSLDENLITFLDVETRDQAICSLIDLFDLAGKLPEKEAFKEAIFHREQLVSTGIGVGVALPHAKLKGLTQFSIAIGIQRNKGIDWDALDLSPVRLIFMIGGPEDRQSEYLQILSQLTSAIKSVELRKSLLKATHSRQVLDLFSQF
ncbi:MAG: PTS sugar transporter subunit IIA [Chlamydiia bacterium]|nr:PTS sugar transporter subunit IIA [Chlamydiia bacterium]